MVVFVPFVEKNSFKKAIEKALFEMTDVCLITVMREAEDYHQILTKRLESTKKRKLAPEIEMWEGYENALVEYYNAAANEYHSRFEVKTDFLSFTGKFVLPKWYGQVPVHYSHLAQIRKLDPDYFPELQLPEAYVGKGVIFPSSLENIENEDDPNEECFVDSELSEKKMMSYFTAKDLRTLAHEENVSTKRLVKKHLYYILVKGMTTEDAIEKVKSEDGSSSTPEKKKRGRHTNGPSIMELKEIAKDLKIRGYSKLNKADLIKKIEEYKK